MQYDRLSQQQLSFLLNFKMLFGAFWLGSIKHQFISCSQMTAVEHTWLTLRILLATVGTIPRMHLTFTRCQLHHECLGITCTF